MVVEGDKTAGIAETIVRGLEVGEFISMTNYFPGRVYHSRFARVFSRRQYVDGPQLVTVLVIYDAPSGDDGRLVYDKLPDTGLEQVDWLSYGQINRSGHSHESNVVVRQTVKVLEVPFYFFGSVAYTAVVFDLRLADVNPQTKLVYLK